MKPVTTGIVAALLTLSPAALANDVNPDLIDLSGLTAAAMLVKTSKDYEWKNILIVVDNKSAAKFDTTRWSCVILNKSQLIHEEAILVDNVRPNSYAIKSQRLGYESGPVDGVQCRLVNVQIGPPSSASISEHHRRSRFANARGVAVVTPAIADAELKAFHAGGIRGIRFSLAIERALDEARRRRNVGCAYAVSSGDAMVSVASHPA